MTKRSYKFPNLALLLVLFSGRSGLVGAQLSGQIDYGRDVLPILSDKCYHCHGPDEKARKAKLRLDTKEGAFRVKDGKAVIAPGKSAESELVRRIMTIDPDDLMPPPATNRKLASEQIETLKRWVEQGAKWGGHWAFVPPIRPELPKTQLPSWPRNGIDHFILARLEKEGMNPSAPARKETLLRRIALDLTGVPSTPAEIDTFLGDGSPDAFEKVLDRLLASNRYGERMAVDWLDLARYSDTHGYQMDRYRPMWPYRDWVIKAFNQNLPFDQFITWQLAGDLLPHATKEQRLATAFNRLHMQNEEGGIVEEEYRVAYVVDRVNTMGTAFLGLTFECSRCHDHKYDPITQRDFYSLFALFQNIDESGQTVYFGEVMPVPTLLLGTEEQDAKLSDLRRQIATKEEQLPALRNQARGAFGQWLRSRPVAPSTPQPGPLLDRGAEGVAPSPPSAHRQESDSDPAAVPSPLNEERARVRSVANSEVARTPRMGPLIPGLIGTFAFDEIVSNKVANLANPAKPAIAVESPKLVPGKFGAAAYLNGENGFTVPGLGHFTRADPFSLSLWLKTPAHAPRFVVAHHSKAPIDAGSRGYELLLENGHVVAGLHHMWPGNSLKVMSKEALPTNEWMHVVFTYDGSSRAAGIRLYVNGVPAPTETVRDGLSKDITYEAGEPDLAIGYRFRDSGFKGGSIDDFRMFSRALTPMEVAHVAGRDDLNEAWKAEPDKLTPAQRDGLLDYFVANEFPLAERFFAELHSLRQEQNKLINPIPEIMVMEEMAKAKPAYILKRGAYDAPGESVSGNTPAALSPFPPDQPKNRLGLARWLISSDHPLTARVTVNRAWQQMFGKGIVETSDNFGSQGAQPTHPELLDWLAREFIDTGWDLKRLLKFIAMSATYQQASQADPELLARDPANQLLARGSARRLSAEMLRDQALAASGLLVEKIGGPSVKPYQPEGLWEEIAMGKPHYQPGKGDDLHRRSLYTFWKRTVPHPAMITFDAAERNVCVIRRQQTSTPLQALTLLNDPQIIEAARLMSERMLKEGGAALDDKVAWAFRAAAGRWPSSKETSVLKQLFLEQRQIFAADQQAAAKLLTIGDAVNDPGVSPADLAAGTVLAEAILNHDEAVMRR
jgi:hypothetical protein